MKHNKKRNTAFIYETLTRELTRAIVEKKVHRKNKIVALLKEHFTRGSALADELELYNALLNTTNIQRPVAERLLHETKGAYQILDENTILMLSQNLLKPLIRTWDKIPGRASFLILNHWHLSAQFLVLRAVLKSVFFLNRRLLIA
jgi:hypothetical protein